MKTIQKGWWCPKWRSYDIEKGNCDCKNGQWVKIVPFKRKTKKKK